MKEIKGTLFDYQILETSKSDSEYDKKEGERAVVTKLLIKTGIEGKIVDILSMNTLDPEVLEQSKGMLVMMKEEFGVSKTSLKQYLQFEGTLTYVRGFSKEEALGFQEQYHTPILSYK